MTVPLNPQQASFTTPTNGSIVGMAVNGVPIFNDVVCGNGTNCESTAHREFTKVFDSCMGHIDTGHRYHYHMLPVCLFSALGVPTPTGTDFWLQMMQNSSRTSEFWPESATPSPLIGWALDGFAIMGPYDEDGRLVNSTSLDVCGGRVGTDGVYRYYAMPEPPYFVGCFKGRPGNFSDTYVAKACPVSGVFTSTSRTCKYGPFFLFRTNTVGSFWNAYFLTFGVLNGIMAILILRRLFAAQIIFGSKSAQTVTMALCSFVTVTQCAFFFTDPNNSKSYMPAIILNLLFGVQFWATDGIMAIAVLRQTRIALRFYKVRTRMRETSAGAANSENKKLKKKQFLLREMQKNQQFSSAVNVLTGVKGAEQTADAEEDPLGYTNIFIGLMAVCFVVQTGADILRVVMDKNYWWMSVCRVIYLAAGYAFAVIFIRTTVLIRRTVTYLGRDVVQKLNSFVWGTVRIVVCCVTIATLELAVLATPSLKTSSLGFKAMAVIGQVVRLCLYFLSWRAVGGQIEKRRAEAGTRRSSILFDKGARMSVVDKKSQRTKSDLLQNKLCAGDESEVLNQSASPLQISGRRSSGIELTAVSVADDESFRTSGVRDSSSSQTRLTSRRPMRI